MGEQESFMKKTLVFAIGIFCLSSTLYAGEIYNCKMNKFIFLQDDEVSEGKLSDFSFVVQRDELQAENSRARWVYIFI